MYKNDIIKFAGEQVITTSTMDLQDVSIKEERRLGDLSKWFKTGDTIEFDDSYSAFIDIKPDMNILDSFKKISLKVYRDGSVVDIKKESWHCIRELNKCIVSFFVYGG